MTSLTNGAGALAQTYTFDSFGEAHEFNWLVGVVAVGNRESLRRERILIEVDRRV